MQQLLGIVACHVIQFIYIASELSDGWVLESTVFLTANLARFQYIIL